MNKRVHSALQTDPDGLCDLLPNTDPYKRPKYETEPILEEQWDIEESSQLKQEEESCVWDEAFGLTQMNLDSSVMIKDQ